MPYGSTQMDVGSGTQRRTQSNSSVADTNRTLTDHQSISIIATSTPASTHDSHVAPRTNPDQPEEPWQLAKRVAPTTPSNMAITISRLTEPFHVYHEGPSRELPHLFVRGVMHKTRLFGKSNWVNGLTLFLDTIERINTSDREEAAKAIAIMSRCKSLGKAIKMQREPEWPTPPTTALPSKEVADELVDRYLHTLETVHRVLHIPSFMRDYEALWTSPFEKSTAFTVQLKLVLAIGAATLDEQFSMRAAAIRWVYEAQTWLSAPDFKSRLSIQALQNSILLVVAREATGIGASLIWVSIGSVLRTAVHMGLHRDPDHLQIKDVFAAEMRRRLWNTILELDLTSSLTTGSPPLFSLSNFDTQPPHNFDDDQLDAGAPISRDDNVFTQASAAIALRKSFPVRLAAIKFLNDLESQDTYDETLRLDAQLRAEYRVLRQTLQRFDSASFEIGFVDVLVHRFLLALHVPFFGPSLQESKYAFSRRVVVESSLKIWCAVCPTSALKRSSRGIAIAPTTDQLPRLTICSSGFLRNAVTQACFVIAVELRLQLQEDEGLGPVPIRTDLLAVLEDAKAWSLQAIRAGETNVKGYLLLSVIGVHVEALMQGVGDKDLSAMLVKAMEAIGEECLGILEEIAAGIQVDSNAKLDRTLLNPQPEPAEDWDFMITDEIFNFGSYGLLMD